MKETLKKAGYVYIMYSEDTNTHVLYNLHSKGFERWAAHKNHASYGLVYKNTHLEFASSFSDDQTNNLKRSMRVIQNFGEQHPAFHSTLMNQYRKYIAV